MVAFFFATVSYPELGLSLLYFLYRVFHNDCFVSNYNEGKKVHSLEPQVRLHKVNTEEQVALAVQCGIRRIPTVILLHKGKESNQIFGVLDLNSLVHGIKTSLKVIE